MRLTDLVDTSAAVARTSGRLDKIDRLAALLARAGHDEIEAIVAFLSGSPRQGRIGVGWSRLSAARAAAAAEDPTLTVHEVDAAFDAVARATGRGSTAERARLLSALMARATRAEQDFLVRLLFGELRQGALEGVLVEAVARASGLPVTAVRRAAMLAGDLGLVARTAFAGGSAGLSGFAVQLFRPLQPMLADSADDLTEALGRIRDPALEWKLDGARIQVHRSGDEVRVYSRNLRDVTDAVPEVVDTVRSLAAREAILDGEVIALRGDGAPLPFQLTMRRFGRRLDVDRLRLELPLTPFFFDLLLVDGRPLIDDPQAARFAALGRIAAASLVVPHLAGADAAAADAFLADALQRGHEGVMVKAREAPYAAGSRGQAWIKVKAARTLDLVVLAAEWGHGRRQGWLSNLHLGARDVEGGGFVMLGKTFKGLTDDMLRWQTTRLLELEVGRDDYTVYVRPELVVEIAFNEVQASPHYPAGLALRFARVKRFREDKTAGEADTIATVRQAYERAAAQTSERPSDGRT